MGFWGFWRRRRGPVMLVSTEEQPVDLLAQTPAPARKPPAADAQSAPAPKPPADGQPVPAPNSPVADGQSAPATNTPIVAPSEDLGGAPAPGRTLFPSAKRIKTVSVRPDGTLIWKKWHAIAIMRPGRSERVEAAPSAEAARKAYPESVLAAPRNAGDRPRS